MDSDAIYIGLVVAFLSARACDLHAVRAKIDLTLRNANRARLKTASARVAWLFRACSWLWREIPSIGIYGLLFITLIFGLAAIARTQDYTVAHQLILAFGAAVGAIMVSMIGAMIETLRNELDKISK